MIETTPLRKKLLDLAISGKLVPKTGEWKTVKLGDVSFVTKLAGFEYSKYIVPALASSGIPLFIGKNIRDGIIIDQFEDYISDEVSLSLERSRIDTKCLLLPYVGTIGNVAIFDGMSIAHLGSNVAKIVILDKDALSEEFLTLYIRSGVGQKLLSKKKKATAQESISMAALRELEVPLPPLAEQKAIVKRLEELLALEREIAADSAALDDLITAAKRRILDLAVSGKLVPKTGEWKTAKGREIFEDTESRLPEGEMFDYIDIDSIDNKQHRVIEPKHLLVVNAPSRASRGLRAGDTLFSIVRPYLENIAYIDKKLEHCIASTGFFVCRPKASCDSRYLYTLMTAPYVIKGLNSYMKGDNSPSIRKADILNFVFPLPPLAEQKAIVKRVEELFAVLDAMKGT